MVVLTDTPATARTAAEAAAKAAAAAAAAAAAEAGSDSGSSSGGGSPLKSMLSGRRRKSKRQFESPLLQPIDSIEETSPQPEQQQQQQNGTLDSGVEALLQGPFANGQQQEQQSGGSEEPQSRTIIREVSTGRGKGRVGFHETSEAHAVPLLNQCPPGVGISDSSSSLAQLHLALPQQQQQQEHPEDGPIPIAGRRSSSGGGSSGSGKGGLRTRSKSGPVLLSLVTGQEGDGYSDIINGPEGVAVPIGEVVVSLLLCFHVCMEFWGVLVMAAYQRATLGISSVSQSVTEAMRVTCAGQRLQLTGCTLCAVAHVCCAVLCCRHHHH